MSLLRQLYRLCFKRRGSTVENRTVQPICKRKITTTLKENGSRTTDAYDDENWNSGTHGDAEAATQALVQRRDNWESPHSEDVHNRLHDVRTLCHRHSLAHWLKEALGELARNASDDNHAVIKEAIMVEPMSTSMAGEYDPLRWTHADLQLGNVTTVARSAYSVRLARFVVAAAVLTTFSDHADTLTYMADAPDWTEKPEVSDEISHRLTPTLNPALFSRDDPALYRQLQKLVSLSLSPQAWHLIVAAARVTVITDGQGVGIYSTPRRLLSAVYGPHAVGEAPGRLAITAAWMAYSAVRDCLIDKNPDSNENDADVLLSVIRHHNLLSPNEIAFAQALANPQYSVSAPCMLPAESVIGVRRPVFEKDAVPPRVTTWPPSTFTTGWAGPLCTRHDVEKIRIALEMGERPIIQEPSAGEPSGCFALSYKHDGQGAWRLSENRTKNLGFLVETLHQKLKRPIFLWIDVINAIDNPTATSSSDARAQTLEVFLDVPVLFVARELWADVGSFWICAERLAGICTQGVFGDWLPLIASTDGAVPSKFSPIVADASVCGIRAESSDEDRTKARLRVAKLLLAGNFNAKGISDASDFEGIIRWAWNIVNSNADDDTIAYTDEKATEQDWMGVHVMQNDEPFSIEAVVFPNRLRSGIRKSTWSHDVPEDMKQIEIQFPPTGEMPAVIRTKRETFVACAWRHDVSVRIASIAPMSRVIMQTCGESLNRADRGQHENAMVNTIKWFWPPSFDSF